MIIKKPKLQLPGHVQAISVPTVKPVEEEDDYYDPQASSSNDPSIPLPTTPPTSLMPGDFSQRYQSQSPQGTPEMVPAQDDDDQTELYSTDDTPVLTEEEIAQLQEEDVDTEPYNPDHSDFVDSDGTVFVPLGPKLPNSMVLLILVLIMSVVSISLNSIVLRIARNSQRQNLSLPKKF